MHPHYAWLCLKIDRHPLQCSPPSPVRTVATYRGSSQLVSVYLELGTANRTANGSTTYRFYRGSSKLLKLSTKSLRSY